MLDQIEINKVLLSNQNMLMWVMMDSLARNARGYPAGMPGELQAQLERSQAMLAALQAE